MAKHKQFCLKSGLCREIETDESRVYFGTGEQYANNSTVTHSVNARRDGEGGNSKTNGEAGHA